MSKNNDVSVPIDLVVRSPYRTVAPSPNASDIERFQQNDQEPILVRIIPESRYEILVGEAIWRAAQAVGLHTISVRIMDDVDDTVAASLAAKDAISDSAGSGSTLSRAYTEPRAVNCGGKLLIARQIESACQLPGTSKSAVAQQFGMSLSEVSHYLRVLRLPERIRNYGLSGQLSFGQLRALSRLAHKPDRAEALARKIIQAARGTRYRRSSSITVRKLEQLVNAEIHGADKQSPSHMQPSQPSYMRGNSDIAIAERKLTDSCGHRVEIDFDPKTKSGWVRIQFHDLDDYETVSDMIEPRSVYS